MLTVTEKYVRQAIQRFKKVKPVWKAPVESLFAQAKTQKLTITVNGKPKSWWTAKRIDDMFEDLDDRLNHLTVRVTKGGKGVLRFYWTDCRKIEVV